MLIRRAKTTLLETFGGVGEGAGKRKRRPKAPPEFGFEACG
jgi:hypothetical protein